MSEITATEVKTIKEIASQVASGSIELNEDTLGKQSYDLLKELFLQDSFVLAGCEPVPTGDNYVLFKGTIDELLHWQNLAVEIVVFDLKASGDKKITRHCLLKAAMPASTLLSAHTATGTVLYSSLSEEVKQIETGTFFDEYCRKLNELSDMEVELKETALELYLDNNSFTDPRFIFSSLPYCTGLDTFYPASFVQFCAVADIQAGINLKVKAKVEGGVVDFLNKLLDKKFQDLENATECHGTITKDNEKIAFLVRPAVSAKIEIGSQVTLLLDGIDFAFALQTGDMPWPEVIFSGGLMLFGDKFAASLRLNLFNGQLIVQLKDFPTLGKIISNISGQEKLLDSDALKEILEVSLTEMTMVIELEPKGVSMLNLKLEYASNINLLKDVIAFKPCLKMNIRNPLSPGGAIVEGMLGGYWQLDVYTFLTAIHYPSKEITATLAGEKFIDTGELMSKLFPTAGTFPKIDIQKLEVGGSLAEDNGGAFSFLLEATVVDKIDICGQKIAIEKAQISLTHNNKHISNGSIYAEINFMGVQTQVTIEWTPENGLELTGMTPEDEDVSVTRLFNKFLDITGLPGGLTDFQVSNIQLYAAPKLKTYSFSGEAELDIIPELQVKDIEFSVTRQPLDPKEGEAIRLVNDGSFSTSIVLCGVAINLAISVEHDEDGNPAKEFKGSTSGLDVSLSNLLEDLLKKILPGYADALSDVLPAINLRDIYITYDSSIKEFNLVAVAKIEGRTVKFFFQNRSEHKDADGKIVRKRFALGIKADAGDMSGLPMVGESLKDAKITDLGFVYTSYGEAADTDKAAYEKDDAVFTLPDIKTIAKKTLIKPGEKRRYKRKTSFTGKIQLPGDTSMLELELETSEKVKPPAATGQQQGTSLELYNVAGDKKEPATKFIRVDKKIGPVFLKAIGFSYRDGSLGFLITGHVLIAGLKLTLEGLGIHFVLSELFSGDVKPSPGLNGLGVLYKNAPIEVEGAFKRGIQDGEDVYNGGALIKASNFSISALGSYASVNGKPSLFIYGFYGGTIGGPAFFFVTGIAAGFGYNRRVQIPAIDKVRTFPLVALAMKPEPKKELEEILDELATKNAIAISPGDYWLAAGVRFSSFKIIDSFVLLIVQFGSSVDFTILGLSVLNWPDEKNPIAYIELALLARFGPSSDVIAVQAALTTNSWIFDKSCRITGGFAFYAWVSGEHEGDFVVTLGGYHPKFIKPAHYPSVDRLALNWKLSEVLTIRGEMYFALTPSAIMAGGRWSVEYNLSFLKATVTLWADMVIAWAPYRYRIDAGIRVRIEARIKVLFVRVYFAIEIGAEVHIWGPEFAGNIVVDWSIFSFTIPFGDQARKEPEKLLWDEFSGSFIPAKKPQQTLLAGSAAANEAAINTLDLRITAGISRKVVVEGEEAIIVNPGDLQLSIDSFAPLTEIYTGKISNALTGIYTNQQEIQGDVLIDVSNSIIPISYAAYKNRELPLGIKPMAVKRLNSTLTFSLTAPDGNTQALKLTGTTKGVADALWGRGPLTQGDTPDAKVLSDVLTGMKLTVSKPPTYPVEEIKRTKDDFISIASVKGVTRLTNKAAGPTEDGAEIKIKEGLKDTTKRKSVAEELLQAGLTINTSDLDVLPGTDLRFRQTPNLLSIATNMTGDDQ